MNCNEVKNKWEKYLKGECSAAEEREIEEHLQTCMSCDQLLNDELENQQKNISVQKGVQDDLEKLPVKKQKQIIRRAKWKHRLKTAMFSLGILLILIIVSTILTGAFYMKVGSNVVDVIKVGTKMTIPNISINGSGMSTNIFFSADIEAKMVKALGNEDKAMGEMHGKMRFNNLFTSTDWVDGSYVTKLYFVHPENKEELYNYHETLASTWYALEILPEGTVSELAISFDALYDINDAQRILSEYNLYIPWYAIDTGIESDLENYLSIDTWILGVYDRPQYSLTDNKYNNKSMGNGDRIAEEFKNGIELLVDNKKYAKQFLWRFDENVDLDEIFTYVNENGVKTYGVVVTGPTKELLKLKENEHIRYATLGEVELWNWFDRPGYGVSY